MNRFDYQEVDFDKELELMANQILADEDNYEELQDDDFEPMPEVTDPHLLDGFNYSHTYCNFKGLVALWKLNVKMFPRIRCYAWWMAHNIFAHMFFGLIPCSVSMNFHNWTSRRLNLRAEVAYEDIPSLTFKSYFSWLAHNIFVHPLVGFLPCNFTGRIHDTSAAHAGTAR